MLRAHQNRAKRTGGESKRKKPLSLYSRKIKVVQNSHENYLWKLEIGSNSYSMHNVWSQRRLVLYFVSFFGGFATSGCVYGRACGLRMARKLALSQNEHICNKEDTSRDDAKPLRLFFMLCIWFLAFPLYLFFRVI
jgi:hypothetical protein